MKCLIVALLAAAALPADAATVAKRIPGPDGPWDIARVDAEHNRLLVGRGDGVMAVDLATGAVTAKFVPGARVHDTAVVPGLGVGVSSNGNTNTATVWDAATGAVKAEIKVGLKPDAVAYDPAGGLVWVMTPDDGNATLIDPKTAKAAGTVKIGGSLEYAVADGRGRIWVNVEDKNEIAEIDTAKRTVLRRIALPGCDGPTGLALTTHGTLIASCANNVAKSVDAASGKLLGDIAIGPRPDAVIYDAQRERAYIPTGGDGMLTVIDTSGAEPRKLDAIATQRGARTGAVDPATGNVYLPAARYPNDGSAKPKPLPGSFEIVVVTP